MDSIYLSPCFFSFPSDRMKNTKVLIFITPHLRQLRPPVTRPETPESEKPRQRVSNADQKVFANPESFCDMFINHNSKFIFMAKSASVLGDFYTLYHFVCHTGCFF